MSSPDRETYNRDTFLLRPSKNLVCSSKGVNMTNLERGSTYDSVTKIRRKQRLLW